jgi:hypothetical protein
MVERAGEAAERGTGRYGLGVVCEVDPCESREEGRMQTPVESGMVSHVGIGRT